MANQGFTPEQVIEALNKSNGYISQAAKLLQCSFQTICNYRDRYKEVKEALVELQERELDFTESKLMENIREGKEASIFFKLKTQAKHRGYIERQEIEHSGAPGAPITVKITFD
jgi:transposase